jgi:hypothetical protein
MPYITQSKRRKLNEHMPPHAQDSGELSYKLTQVIRQYMEDHPSGGWNGMIAPVLAAIDGAKIAFINDVVTPYEIAKRQENGGVFQEI